MMIKKCLLLLRIRGTRALAPSIDDPEILFHILVVKELFTLRTCVGRSLTISDFQPNISFSQINTIQWMKNNKTIARSSSKLNLLSNGTFLINNISTKNSGDYTLKMKNKLMRVRLKLAVEGRFQLIFNFILLYFVHLLKSQKSYGSF